MRNTRKIIVILGVVAGFWSCKKTDIVDPNPDTENPVEVIEDEVFSFGNSKLASSYTGDVVTEWNALQLRLFQVTPGYSSPVAARSMAYVNLALYETVVYGMPENQSLKNSVAGLESLPKPENGKNYNWALAANASQYTILRELFPTTSDVMKGRIDTLRRQLEVKFKAGVDEDEIERSIRFGAAIANAVFNISKNDGGHEAFNNNFSTGYIRKGGAASWKATGNQKTPLLPKWGEVNSFLKINAEEAVVVKTPFSFEASSEYFRNAREIYDLSKNLNEVQKSIMVFWQDGELSYTSTGHHLSVINNLARKEGYKMDQMAILNAQMGMAFHDAIVYCMKTKYETDYMRPVTYIRQAIDPTWNSLMADDASPEYTSLPATIAGAAKEILISKFGNEYVFEDDTYAQALGKVPYKGFDSYAKEASLSQFYAGNQLRVSCEQGLENGQKIAKNIMAINFKSAVDSTMKTP